MKTNVSKALVLVLVLMGWSCSKDESSPSVSQEDAADVVGSYLASDLTASTSDAASVSTKTSDNADGRVATNGRTEASSCGVTYDSTLSRSGSIGTAITYAYELTYSYMLNCTSNVPSSLTFGITSSGSYSGPRVSSEGSGEGSWNITGFTGSSYTLNGDFSKTETVTQKTGAQKSFSGNLTLTFTNIMVDKTTKKITGGEITFALEGSITGGAAYAYSGSVTLLGDESATITIGTTSYTVDLANGTVTKD